MSPRTVPSIATTTSLTARQSRSRMLAQRGAGALVFVAVGGDGEHRVAVRCDPRLAGGPGRGPGELDQHDDHGHDRAGQADAQVRREDQGRADHERGRASTVFTRWSSSRGLNGLMM